MGSFEAYSFDVLSTPPPFPPATLFDLKLPANPSYSSVHGRRITDFVQLCYVARCLTRDLEFIHNYLVKFGDVETFKNIEPDYINVLGSKVEQEQIDLSTSSVLERDFDPQSPEVELAMQKRSMAMSIISFYEKWAEFKACLERLTNLCTLNLDIANDFGSRGIIGGFGEDIRYWRNKAAHTFMGSCYDEEGGSFRSESAWKFLTTSVPEVLHKMRAFTDALLFNLDNNEDLLTKEQVEDIIEKEEKERMKKEDEVEDEPPPTFVWWERVPTPVSSNEDTEEENEETELEMDEDNQDSEFTDFEAPSDNDGWPSKCPNCGWHPVSYEPQFDDTVFWVLDEAQSPDPFAISLSPKMSREGAPLEAQTSHLKPGDPTSGACLDSPDGSRPPAPDAEIPSNVDRRDSYSERDAVSAFTADETEHEDEEQGSSFASSRASSPSSSSSRAPSPNSDSETEDGEGDTSYLPSTQFTTTGSSLDEYQWPANYASAPPCLFPSVDMSKLLAAWDEFEDGRNDGGNWAEDNANGGEESSPNYMPLDNLGEMYPIWAP